MTGEPTPGGSTAGARWRRRDDGRGALVFGALLIVVGAWFLLRRAIPGLDLENWWPVFLIGIGVVLLVGAARGRDNT